MDTESFAVAVGASTGTLCAAIGLIFLKYWRRTGDELFAWFATAFWLMALNRLLLAMVGDAQEAPTALYLLRFAAFVLILLGIVRKNLGSRRP
jgi:hypothetical protein